MIGLGMALDTAVALFKRARGVLSFLALPALVFAAVQTARIEGFLWWKGYKADRAAFQAERARWIEADRINRKSIDTLLTAITDQTQAVLNLSATAERRQKAAQDALRRAEKRGEALGALTVRIERERAPRGAAGKCETPRAVLDARGEL